MSPPVRSVVSDEKLPRSVQVVVIGGGISEFAAAWELARRGAGDDLGCHRDDVAASVGQFLGAAI